MVQAILYGNNVMFINTVKKFSYKRFESIINSLKLNSKEKENLMKKVIVRDLEVNDFDNFILTIEDFIFKNNIKMIILDSVTGLFDVQFINDNNEIDFCSRTLFMNRITNLFKSLIVDYNLFFIVTNNVKSDIEGDKSDVIFINIRVSVHHLD